MAIERLKKRYQYLQVAKSPVRIKTKNFILQAAKASDSFMGIRFGITASKRVGSSVVRNRAKRRIRALIQNITNTFLIPTAAPSLDFVVIAFPTTWLAPFSELSMDFSRALADCIQRIK